MMRHGARRCSIAVQFLRLRAAERPKTRWQPWPHARQQKESDHRHQQYQRLRILRRKRLKHAGALYQELRRFALCDRGACDRHHCLKRRKKEKKKKKSKADCACAALRPGRKRAMHLHPVQVPTHVVGGSQAQRSRCPSARLVRMADKREGLA